MDRVDHKHKDKMEKEPRQVDMKGLFLLFGEFCFDHFSIDGDRGMIVINVPSGESR